MEYDCVSYFFCVPLIIGGICCCYLVFCTFGMVAFVEGLSLCGVFYTYNIFATADKRLVRMTERKTIVDELSPWGDDFETVVFL